MTLPTDRQVRKDAPMARGLLDYFPDALAEVAHVSFVGNEQHNPGQPLHWARHLSTDHADCIVRHLADRGKLDTDGCRHAAKVAWRALALLQEELEAERDLTVRPWGVVKEQCHDCGTLYVIGDRHACSFRKGRPGRRADFDVCTDPPLIAFQPCDDCHSPLCEHTSTCSLELMAQHRGS